MIICNRQWAEKQAANRRDQMAHLSAIIARIPFEWGRPNPHRVWAVRQLWRVRKRLDHYEAQL